MFDWLKKSNNKTRSWDKEISEVFNNEVESMIDKDADQVVFKYSLAEIGKKIKMEDKVLTEFKPLESKKDLINFVKLFGNHFYLYKNYSEENQRYFCYYLKLRNNREDIKKIIEEAQKIPKFYEETVNASSKKIEIKHIKKQIKFYKKYKDEFKRKFTEFMDKELERLSDSSYGEKDVVKFISSQFQEGSETTFNNIHTTKYDFEKIFEKYSFLEDYREQLELLFEDKSPKEMMTISAIIDYILQYVSLDAETETHESQTIVINEIQNENIKKLFKYVSMIFLVNVIEIQESYGEKEISFENLEDAHTHVSEGKAVSKNDIKIFPLEQVISSFPMQVEVGEENNSIVVEESHLSTLINAMIQDFKTQDTYTLGTGNKVEILRKAFMDQLWYNENNRELLTEKLDSVNEEFTKELLQEKFLEIIAKKDMTLENLVYETKKDIVCEGQFKRELPFEIIKNGSLDSLKNFEKEIPNATSFYDKEKITLVLAGYENNSHHDFLEYFRKEKKEFFDPNLFIKEVIFVNSTSKTTKEKDEYCYSLIKEDAPTENLKVETISRLLERDYVMVSSYYLEKIDMPFTLAEKSVHLSDKAFQLYLENANYVKEEGVEIFKDLVFNNSHKKLQHFLNYSTIHNVVQDSINVIAEDGYNALNFAIYSGYYGIAKTLIAYDINVNFVDEEGDTPLKLTNYAIEEVDNEEEKKELEEIKKLLEKKGAKLEGEETHEQKVDRFLTYFEDVDRDYMEDNSEEVIEKLHATLNTETLEMFLNKLENEKMDDIAHLVRSVENEEWEIDSVSKGKLKEIKELALSMEQEAVI